MIYTALLLLSTTCPVPKLLGLPWEPPEAKRITIWAQEGCERHYSNQHCVVRIRKTAEYSYQVTCTDRKYL